MKSKSKIRCPWVIENDDLYVKYHDEEWGVKVTDDRILFEFLILESFQAGLSWRVVLNKRKNFEKAFVNFDPKKIAKFDSKKVTELMKDTGIVRNKLKIEAAINNAQRFLEVQKEFGSFLKYQNQFTNGKIITHKFNKISDYPTSIDEAEDMAKDLKKRGFKFLGPKVIYAHMQAVGMVDDHTVECFKSKNQLTFCINII